MESSRTRTHARARTHKRVHTYTYALRGAVHVVRHVKPRVDAKNLDRGTGKRVARGSARISQREGRAEAETPGASVLRKEDEKQRVLARRPSSED